MAGKRIVLIEVSADEVSDFVHAIREHGTVEYIDQLTTEVHSVTAAVEAVVARPKAYCRCQVVEETKYQRRRRMRTGAGAKMHPFTRGPKFGWWICANCGKPSQAAVMHWITSMLVGANDLLPQIIGEGDPIDPQKRWERDGGVPNEHANANHFTPGIVKARDGVLAPERKRRGKATQATGYGAE